MKTRLLKKHLNKFSRLTKLMIRKDKQSGKKIHNAKFYLKMYSESFTRKFDHDQRIWSKELIEISVECKDCGKTYSTIVTNRQFVQYKYNEVQYNCENCSSNLVDLNIKK